MARLENEDIRLLLERYFDGATTLGEEALLREQFACGDVPPDLEYARAMFAHFAAAGREAPVALGRWGRRSFRLRAACVAAAVAAVAITLGISNAGNETIYCYIDGKPITDYDTAYAYTQGAMALIYDSCVEPVERIGASDGMRAAMEILDALSADGDNEI